MTPKSWSFCQTGTYKRFHLPSSFFESWVIYTHFFMIKKRHSSWNKIDYLVRFFFHSRVYLVSSTLIEPISGCWDKNYKNENREKVWQKKELKLLQKIKNKNLDNCTRRKPTKWISNLLHEQVFPDQNEPTAIETCSLIYKDTQCKSIKISLHF